MNSPPCSFMIYNVGIVAIFLVSFCIIHFSSEILLHPSTHVSLLLPGLSIQGLAIYNPILLAIKV